MRTRARTLAAGLAAAALIAGSVIGTSSASAEVINIDGAGITGELTVAGKDAALPAGASVSGTYDDETGALALQVTVPQGQLIAEVAGIGDVPVLYQLTNPGGVTGTVTDGAVTATGDFELAIVRAEIGDGVDLEPCAFGPIAMDFAGTLEGSILTLADPEFVIPATEDACAGLAAIINPQVASEGNTANLVIDLDLPAEEPTTTTEPVEGPTTTEPGEGPTTTEPGEGPTTTEAPPASGPGAVAPASGAQPVAGAANYTG